VVAGEQPDRVSGLDSRAEDAVREELLEILPGLRGAAVTARRAVHRIDVELGPERAPGQGERGRAEGE